MSMLLLFAYFCFFFTSLSLFLLQDEQRPTSPCCCGEGIRPHEGVLFTHTDVTRLIRRNGDKRHM